MINNRTDNMYIGILDPLRSILPYEFVVETVKGFFLRVYSVGTHSIVDKRFGDLYLRSIEEKKNLKTLSVLPVDFHGTNDNMIDMGMPFLTYFFNTFLCKKCNMSFCLLGWDAILVKIIVYFGLNSSNDSLISSFEIFSGLWNFPSFDFCQLCISSSFQTDKRDDNRERMCSLL